MTVFNSRAFDKNKAINSELGVGFASTLEILFLFKF